MTHEYPHNPMLDSVTISRVIGLAPFGFTRRQRELLVTVMVHSGCFLERQYCAFTATARGQNSREFVARLVARGLARAIEPGPVRRGRLYHIHHKPLYEAIGHPDSRNRRLPSIGRMVERVMILDAVLGDRRCWWLSPEADKRTFFDVTQETGLRPEEYPHITFRSGSQKTVRCFPDKLPIGIEKEDTSRFVFLYLVNRRVPSDFRQFLIRHHSLLLNLHRWTMRLLVPRRFRKSVALYKAALREELWTPLNPSVGEALETYFRERKEQGRHLGDRLREELTLVEIDRHGSKVEEFDVEGILSFAERVLPRASDLWIQASLEQRQRLQRLFFPEGVAFSGKAFDRTVVTSSLFEYLRPPDVSNENSVDQTGIAPAG